MSDYGGGDDDAGYDAAPFEYVVDPSCIFMGSIFHNYWLAFFGTIS
jgi:hypothetical protein